MIQIGQQTPTLTQGLSCCLLQVEHFDAGVRHWLLQLQQLFGEDSAIAALHAIETAANLEGVRRMKAFITTRLIDHYEQMVWSQGGWAWQECGSSIMQNAA